MAAQVRFQAAKLLIHFIGGDAALSMSAKAAASVKPRLGCLRNDHLYVMQYDFDASSVKIGRSDDVEKRRKILQDLIQLQHDEAINIFLVSYNNIHAFGANVQGFRNINNTITYGKMSFK
jgi:hypothetical protein